MSTAMQIIEKANREGKGIVIIVSGAEKMGTRIPIRVRFKNSQKNGAVQETDSHGEELTLELSLHNGTDKFARICGAENTKVRVSEFLFTDSVKEGMKAYAFLSAHVFTSLDEVENPQTNGIPFIPEAHGDHHGNEW